MIVSAHQPNFAPWLGFFDKALHSDVLVLLDTVQFIKRGYQNRTQLKGVAGPQWLTVPVITKGRYDQATWTSRSTRRPTGRRVHLRTLRGVLAKAPYRDVLLEAVEPIYGREGVRRLVDLNVAVIREVTLRLGIATRLVLASELDVTGSSTRLMLNLTRAVGGDVYLSGPTGRTYLEPELLRGRGRGPALPPVRGLRVPAAATAISRRASAASTTSPTPGSLPGTAVASSPKLRPAADRRSHRPDHIAHEGLVEALLPRRP